MEVDDEDRFLYVEDIPQLLEIASSKVALVMWHSFISRSKLNATRKQVEKIYFEFGNISKYVLGKTDDYEKHCDEMVECLNVPKVIRKLVRNSLDSIVNEMNLYIEELFHIIGEYFFDSDWCVWLSNGKIDYRQSAMKILESTTSQLNDVQKFAIMCEFCFEDQIARFPMDSLPLGRYGRNTWEVNYSCLLEYWYYHTKKELHKMETINSIFYIQRMGCSYMGRISSRPSQSFPSTIEHFRQFRINDRPSGPPTLLNTRMALSRFNKCWTTFEYFWNRLGTDEQVNLAKIIFEFESYDNSSRRLERLLGLMSWYQQRSLLSLIHTKVIKSFIKTDSSKPAHWAWTQSKDLITIDTFVETVTYLFKCKLDVEEWMSWLVDIWDSATDSYKISAAERITDELLSRFTFSNRPSWSALEFLCRILMQQSVDWRRNEASKQTDLLVFGIADHHHSSNEVLKLFLPSADVRSKIKKLILKRDCMSEAITDRHFIYDVDRWNVLSKFIDELFLENRSLASETKKKFITSRLSNFPHFKSDDVFDVTQLMRIVDSEFKGNEVNDLKRTLFLSFVSKFDTKEKCRWYKGFFDEKYFHHFVKWCIGNGDRTVLEYEDGAFVDAVFNDVFDVLNEEYIKKDKFDESLLSNLNKFLVLLVGSDEEVKTYKLNQITPPRDLKIFYSIERNDDSSMLILSKFFENDELAINKFKSKKRKSTR